MSVRKTIPAGTRFTRLVAIEPGLHDAKNKSTTLCVCDCGTKVIVPNSDLKSGHTRSCGCFYRQRGGSDNPAFRHGFARKDEHVKTYGIWKNMKIRCQSKNNPSYRNYGARGITVCERWNSFQLFLEDMGECPYGRSIDRIDNNLGYFKENCRWATRGEQSRNTRRNVIFTVDGITGCFKDLCAAFNIDHGTAMDRYIRGWPAADIFKKTVRHITKSRR